MSMCELNKRNNEGVELTIESLLEEISVLKKINNNLQSKLDNSEIFYKIQEKVNSELREELSIEKKVSEKMLEVSKRREEVIRKNKY